MAAAADVGNEAVALTEARDDHVLGGVLHALVGDEAELVHSAPDAAWGLVGVGR